MWKAHIFGFKAFETEIHHYYTNISGRLSVRILPCLAGGTIVRVPQVYREIFPRHALTSLLD